MTEVNHFADRLREPLNETTRRARRNLMASSVIGVVISKVGLVPTKLTAFGVEFSSANQQALITLLIAAIAYFLINFSIYLYSEMVAWRAVITSKEIESLIEEAGKKKASARILDDDERETFREYAKEIYAKTMPVFLIRLSIELVIPVLFAAYCIFSLLSFEIEGNDLESSVAVMQDNTWGKSNNMARPR